MVCRVLLFETWHKRSLPRFKKSFDMNRIAQTFPLINHTYGSERNCLFTSEKTSFIGIAFWMCGGEIYFSFCATRYNCGSPNLNAALSVELYKAIVCRSNFFNNLINSATV